MNQPPPLSVQQTGDIICAAAYLIAAVWSAGSKLDGRRKGWMVAGCLTMTAWAATLALANGSATKSLLTGSLEVLRDLMWIGFLLALPGVGMSVRRLIGPRWPVILAVTLGTIGAGATFAARKGWSELLMSLNLLLPVSALLLLETLCRNTDHDGRWGIKSLCLGLGLLFIFDFVFHVDALFAGAPDASFIEGRGWVDAFAVPLLLLSVHRSQSWRFHLSRHVAFQSVVLLGSGLYLLVMAALGEALHAVGGSPGVQLVFLVASVLVLVMIGSSRSVRSRIRVGVSKHFFRHKYDYREIWRNFVRDISPQGQTVTLPHRILHAVADIFDCPCGALWVLQPDQDCYVTAASWNFGEKLPSEPADGPLARYLRDQRGVVALPEFRRLPARYPGLSLPLWLQTHPRAWLLAPLIHNDTLRGFIVLGVPRSTVAITWEELELLQTIGEQAASTLAEDQSLRALVDATRLEEFNRWSAFLVHDIKSIVNQMSLLVANAETHAHDHAFQRDVVATVAASVLRMRTILEQLNSHRLRDAASTTGVDIAALLRQVGDRWRRSIPSILSPDAASSLLVKAREDTLVSVLDHLIQNAFEASGAHGHITLALRRKGSEGILEVRDDGPGMDPGFVQDSLFKPLASSKPNGFGLGAFQVRHLVRSMGGKLEVDSTPGRGTSMLVHLPLFEAGRTIKEKTRESL